MYVTDVTLTGADETVTEADLVSMSERFPFVEWGILFSPSRQGAEPRYPRLAWIAELCKWSNGLRRAAHLCGQEARAVFAGKSEWFERWGDAFPRVQLNGYAEAPLEADAEIVKLACEHFETKFILQISNAEAMERAIEISRLAPNVEALWDMSGGRGVTSSVWPPQPGRLRMGYAGGIGPDNVIEVLRKLRDQGQSYTTTWIDMESKLRSDDGARFDVAKCEDVLTKAATLVCHKIVTSTLYGKFAPA